MISFKNIKSLNINDIMKTEKILLVLFILFSVWFFSQNKLNDPSIVAQHKRQVYESWGNFRPYPEYVLGIQTNFAYATIWGWLSPSINRDYKDGADIRPLKPTGLEVQRLAEVEVQRKEAEKIKIEVDTIYKRNLQDLAHWTSATVDADPLWLLYYKRMLTPLKNFPDNPQSYNDWLIKDNETYQLMITTGTIKRLQEQLDLLKDKYKISRTVDMPRGKRFLLYHETLIGWRKFMSELKRNSQQSTLALDYKKIIDGFRNKKNEISAKSRTDKEIIQNIMIEYKHQF